MQQASAGDPGDTIRVAPGIHSVTSGEVFPIVFKSGVTLISTSAKAPADTIIDGAGDTVRSGLFVSNGNASSATKLGGFTLINGTTAAAQGFPAEGGAIRISGGNANVFTIIRNIFRDNAALGYASNGAFGDDGGPATGGAIHASASTIHVLSNVFETNRASGGGAKSLTSGAGGNADGGAIFVAGNGRIINNTFHGNYAFGGNRGSSGDAGGGRGGAVIMDGPLDVLNNLFTNNRAINGTGTNPVRLAGALLAISAAGPTIDHNDFFGNQEGTSASLGDTFGSAAMTVDPLYAGSSIRRPRLNSPVNAAGVAAGAAVVDLEGTLRPATPAIGALEVPLRLRFQGVQEAPPTGGAATGLGIAFYDPHLRRLDYSVALQNLAGTETMAHIHGPAARGANAGILFTLPPGDIKVGSQVLSAADESSLISGQLYMNVHTSAFPAGELRAQLDDLGPAVAAPLALAFGVQSNNTTSPGLDVYVHNVLDRPLAVATISVSNPTFSHTSNCPASLPVSGICKVTVHFKPFVSPPQALNSTQALSANLVLGTDAPTGNQNIPLRGTMEHSLVTHFYRSILRRDADAAGHTFWKDESVRVTGLGAQLNETWFSMAQAFYGSAEYAAFGRDDGSFLTDLYYTFFNRAPDSGGLVFWSGQLAAGLPRGIVMNAFMFSPEFRSFTAGTFGSGPAVRPEVDTVVDFYRGFMGRLPDSAGFNYWLARFRAAQCTGASAVLSEVEAISSYFANSAEYIGFARTNAQYITDLYNAFMRRGGELAGVQHWISQLATRSREAVRIDFKNSPEFEGRVNAMLAAGCLP